MRRLAAVAIVLAVAAAPAGAEPIEFSAQRRGDAVEMQGAAVLRVDPLRAWQTLTAYERYASFIPDLASSRILSREGNRVVLEQRGHARFLWVTRPMIARLEVTETAPSVVESRLIEGSVRDLRGRYELSPAGEALRLTYSGLVVPDDDWIGPIDLVAIRQHAARQFRALVHEIERAAALGAGAAEAK